MDDAAALTAELARLQKVVDALMDRAEEATERATSDFGVFQATLMLEAQVRARTRELQATMAALESAHQVLKESQARFSALFDLMPGPAALLKLEDGRLIEVNRSFEAFFGRQRAALIGRRLGPEELGVWTSPPDLEALVELVDTGKGLASDYRAVVQRGDGRLASMLVSGRVLVVEEGTCLLLEFHDVTETQRHEERLVFAAHHDPLTRLPNRQLLLDRLALAMSSTRRTGRPMALCYLDLDGFKGVNDRHGHLVGDELLVQVGRRLDACLRTSDTVARLGGDEFALVLTQLDETTGLEDVLERILATLARPYQVAGHSLGAIGASMGVTVFPTDDASAEALLEHADLAMYAAKKAGKARYRHYEPAPAR
jgi:diguanylate cyclase (GGDEF)-like protein/PAS domain S-box-containing protein